jgi:hypothetical protein
MSKVRLETREVIASRGKPPQFPALSNTIMAALRTSEWERQ